MKHLAALLTLALTTSASLVLAQPKGKGAIPSPQARAEVISSLEKVLAAREYTLSPTEEQTKNPFYPTEAVQVSAGPKVTRPASDAEFLEILAAQLSPTGVLMLGDNSMLLFGEKKIKVGETLVVPFDNTNYEVEVIEVGRTAFTVRFNQAKVTRPIKPAKAP